MLDINIKKKYNHFTLDCSMKVNQGYITGIIGQNGAGKTTTLKAILNLISIDEGYIRLFDHDKLTNEDKQKIGVVLSNSGFCERFKISDIISILENLYQDFDKDEFIKQCHIFQLPFDKKIKEFSNGMKAKLKIIIAMTHHAKLLILDEPTAGLDAISRDEVLSLLRDYMEKNDDCSILISSHISSDLENLCDELYMIDDGKIILHEETDVLLNQYAILKVNEDQYNELDRQYLLKRIKQNYGYDCLTNQKQYYFDNYPHIVIENNNIDELIMMMIRGENIC